MYRSSIRFNERELSYYAINIKPDKEGLLEKKGAVRGQGISLVAISPRYSSSFMCTILLS
uniref:Uncharacterized protein n=1 Tax=Amphimedon queenslandica TaxID=400682 RepID=A0A1X7TNI0_AMPQE